MSDAAAAISEARKFLGTPYVWGGSSHSGIDCSGLVMASYAALGVTMPHEASQIQDLAMQVQGPHMQMQPGDLLFFGNPAYHVAIYLGNGKMIQAPEPGQNVEISPVPSNVTSVGRINIPAGVSAKNPVSIQQANQMYRKQGGGSTPDQAPDQVQPTMKNFFTAVLQGLGIQASPANLQSMYSVAQHEGQNNRYNPLNSVIKMPGSWDFNSNGGDPVQGYTSFDQGVKATIQLLQGGHWAGVVHAMHSGEGLQQVLGAWDAAYTWAPGTQIAVAGSGWATKSVGADPGTGASGNFNGSGPSGVQYKAAIGDLAGLISSIPDLQDVFDKAVQNGWSVARFQQEIEQTDWYQNHSATARSLMAQRVSDPATWRRSLQNTMNEVSSIVQQNGWSIDPGQLRSIANRAMMTGNDTNTTWLDSQLGDVQKFGGKSDFQDLQGGMATTVQQLQQEAGAYGVRFKPIEYERQANNILSGATTIDTYTQNMRKLAKSQFPGLSDQIDNGMTVADVAAPYVNSMSSLLETDPSQFDTFTPKIRKALQGTGQSPDGKSTVSPPTPLWKFDEQVRNDPRWQFTSNAHAEMADTLTQLAQDWGFA